MTITKNVIAWMKPSVLFEDRPKLTEDEWKTYIELRRKRTLRQKMFIQQRREMYADRAKFLKNAK
jgi:hypothetical protein